MVAVLKRNAALGWAIAAIGLLIVVGGAVRISGVRPYGEEAILAQIAHEDSALCGKFGIAVATLKFSDCVADLADLRKRHAELLAAYTWL
jgi:hypothetical protein